MSLREARICDWRGGAPERLCDRAAIGVCLVCEKDLCEVHTLSIDGAVRLSVGIYTGGPLCSHDGKSATPAWTAQETAPLCKSCLSVLTGLIAFRMQESVSALLTQFQLIVKAAISEEALK